MNKRIETKGIGVPIIVTIVIAAIFGGFLLVPTAVFCTGWAVVRWRHFNKAVV